MKRRSRLAKSFRCPWWPHGTLLGRWTSRGGHWRLEARYSVRRVLDAATQGSGLQTIYSPWRNDLAFQLRVKI